MRKKNNSTGKRGILNALLIGIFILADCSGPSEPAPTAGAIEKNGTSGYGQWAISTEDGLYYTTGNGYLRYFDQETKEDVLVCPKPECRHLAASSSRSQEEICPAYLFPGGAAFNGFIQNGSLYTVETDINAPSASFHLKKSGLDRSEIQEIAEIGELPLYSYAVIENEFYYPKGVFLEEGDQNQPEPESELSGLITSLKVMNSIKAVSLNSGKERVIAPERSDFNGHYEILTVLDNKLYYRYTFFDEPYDGTNFSEAGYHQEYFVYDPLNEKTESVFEQLTSSSVERLIASGEKLILLLGTGAPGYDRTEEYQNYEMCTYDPETMDLQTLLKLDQKPQMFTDLVIFEKEKPGHFQYFYYSNPQAVSEVKVDLDGNYLTDAGRYFFVHRDDYDPSLMYKLYEKEAFLRGKEAVADLVYQQKEPV